MDNINFIKKYFSDNNVAITPLIGGMMNESFLVKKQDEEFVFYFPTANAKKLVNRHIEKQAQRIAYNLGITSENIFFDNKNGIKINRYIKGISIDKTDDFDINKIATIINTLHQSKEVSDIDYLPFTRFINYEKQANQYNHVFDNEYFSLKNTLFAHQSYLESQKKCLCHNDAQRSNIIKSDNNDYYLIDYEFAGNNDPLYDIAAFANGNIEDGEKLLKACFITPSKDEWQRFYLWRIFISLQWYLVAIDKHYQGEGEIHQMDFLKVANHFLQNALLAENGLKKLLSC